MMNVIQSKIQQHSFTLNPFLRTSTRSLWISIGILFAAYLYFVGAITFSVINQRSLAQDTKRLVSVMSTQEVKYLALQKNLTHEFALETGMTSASGIAYATPQRAFAWNVGR